MASQENLYKLVLLLVCLCVSVKGKPVTKYYFVYNGNLVSTTKTVVDKYELAKAYGVRIALIIIKNKRIALN